MENPNPVIYEVRQPPFSPDSLDNNNTDNSVKNPLQVYNLIRSICDPEHPLTLEQLGVVSPDHIRIEPLHAPEILSAEECFELGQLVVSVDFTPTIPHCSMAALIGLCIRVLLAQKLPLSYVVRVKIREGTHIQEVIVNRQLGDKERVGAALENDRLAEVVKACCYGPPRPGIAL